MKIFSHAIELPGRTRSEAWGALARLARTPELVVAGLEKSEVAEFADRDGVLWLKRTKDFGGGMRVEDSVCLIPETRLEIHVAAGENWPRSWEEIELEETPRGVKLSFSYGQEKPQQLDSPRYAELRNEAYRNKDRALADLVEGLLAAA